MPKTTRCARCNQPFDIYEWQGKPYPRYKSVIRSVNGRVTSLCYCPACAVEEKQEKKS